MEQINIHATTATADKFAPINAAIMEKFFTLLKIYKFTLLDDFPAELLTNSKLYNNLNQTILKFITQPVATMKPFLLQNQSKHLYNTNHEAINLLYGIDNFLNELIDNNGHISLSMIDKHAFKLGTNLAITPGKIIYQNELMQLIQYLPSTDTVYASPILFIPPWINKYYVLDLKPENSMVKWLVDQGFTVFMISWVNPDEQLANKCWENYLLEGPITALNIISSKKLTSIHAVGYCIGGTLLSCVLAYLKHNNDNRIISATYLNTLLDFTQPGEIKKFIDPEQLAILDYAINTKGYLDGRLLDFTFNMLRPQELIWSAFVNNYLLEQKTKPLDFLFWNADSTNLPKKMFVFYLQNIYLKNLLKTSRGITLNNIPIDLTTVTTPIFFVASEKDHIVPWKSSYTGVHMHKSNATFVLSESGHIIGIINPPAKNKYGFKTNNYNYHTPEQWLQTATRYEGSWWPYWKEWLIKQNFKQISANKRSIAQSCVIENAPGSYVLKRM